MRSVRWFVAPRSTNTANYSGLDTAQVRALAEMLVQARGTLGLDDEQLAELDAHVEVMRDGKDEGSMRRALTWIGGLATSAHVDRRPRDECRCRGVGSDARSRSDCSNWRDWLRILRAATWR